jgi:ribulose-phosphate 3-epimerase
MLTTAPQLIDARPGLSVGILTADLLRLGEELTQLDGARVSVVHVDVMDGVFCPTTTVGPPIVKALPDRFVKDVHLMIDEPLEKVGAYIDAGAGIVSFHVEATRHPHRVLQSLAGNGVVRGVALNPGTPLTAVEPLLDDLELLLVLAVNPGWGGQKFLPATERKLAAARALLAGREVVLAVDGGITKENIGRIASLGVDLIVAGSAVFDGGAADENARFLVEAARSARAREPGPSARSIGAPVAAGVDSRKEE